MAIINVYRIRDGARSAGGDLDSHTYRYKVETNDPTHGPDICWTSNLIPAEGSTVLRPGLPSLVVKTREAEHLPESPYFFVVTVDAEEREASGSGDDDASRWDVSISIDGLAFEEPVVADVETGKPIINSAGIAFDPPLTEVFFDERITISFKTNRVSQGTVAGLRGKINQNAVTMNVNGYVRTFAKETLWLANVRQDTVARPGGGLRDPDWQEQYELVYRADTWTRRPVDQGFYEFAAGSSTEVWPIRDKNTEPLSTPSFLDGSGHKLSAGANAVRLSFKTKKKANFAPLFVGF